MRKAAGRSPTAFPTLPIEPRLVAAAVMGMGVVGVAEIDTDGDTPDEIRCNPLLEFLERRVQVLHDVTSMKSR